MIKTFKLKGPHGDIEIGEQHPCFIIAELSANHGGDLQKAKRIIQSSAKAGANAIKLQTYLPETMTIDCNNEYFQVKSKSGPSEWNVKLFDLYKAAYTPWEWHKELKQFAENLGMVFFSSPFDATAVEFLEELGVQIYKIASYELTDIPLLKKVAQTGKPVILSVGFGLLDEITLALDTLKNNGAGDIALLYCVTNYSKSPDLENTNLSTIKDLQQRFNVVVGFSDNTGGVEIPLQAAYMGASIIEKHVIDENDNNALDGKFSLQPSELSDFVKAIRRFEAIAGRPFYGLRNDNEKYFHQFRRSIFVTKDIQPGTPLDASNIKVIRPAYGLEPKHYENVLGKLAVVFIKRGTPLKWEYLE